jgi:hypothetical protein
MKRLPTTRTMSLVRRRGAKPAAAFAAAVAAAAFALPLAVFAGPAAAKHSARAEHRSHRGEHGYRHGTPRSVTAGTPARFFAGPRANIASTNCTGPIPGRPAIDSGDTAVITPSGTVLQPTITVTVKLHDPFLSSQTFFVQVAQHSAFGCIGSAPFPDNFTVTVSPGTSLTSVTKMFPRRSGSNGAVVSAGIPVPTSAFDPALSNPAYYELTTLTSF